MLQRFLFLTTSLAIPFVVQPALADIILPGPCHMGTCWDSLFVSKTLLQQGEQGSLYAVELADRSWPDGAEPPATFGVPQVSYVYCSTTQPAYIFGTEGFYYAHLLNPGGEWFGYNQSDYPVYWATCHNFVGPDFFSEEITQRATELGYPLNLPSDQIELRNLLDIME